MVETESVRDSAGIEKDHVQPVGGRWARRCECVVVQESSKITYILGAGDGQDGVSAWLCNYRERSPTACGRGMGEIVSFVCFSLSKTITYHLRAGEERDQWNLKVI